MTDKAKGKTREEIHKMLTARSSVSNLIVLLVQLKILHNQKFLSTLRMLPKHFTAKYID
jgi:hypothetical protein